MLLRQTLLYLPAQLLAPLAQFTAAVVWTHWMSPEAYGVVTFIVAAQDLVFVICLSWWSSFCLRYMASFGKGDLDTYRRSEAAVLATTIAVAAAASLGLIAYVGLLPNWRLDVAAIIFLVTRSIDVHFAERARAQERIFDYTVAQLAGPVAGFALALALVRALGPTPAAALAGFALPQAIAALWLRRRLRVELSLRRPDATMMKRALAYGLPMVAGGVFGWVSLNGIRFVVQDLGGDAALGLFAVGWSLGQRLSAVTAMLVTAAAFPLAVRRFATRPRDEAMRQFSAGGTLLVGLVVPAAIGLCHVSPLLVDLMVAPAFRPMTLAVLPSAVLIGAIRNVRLHYADQSFLLFERTNLGIGVNAAEAGLVLAGSIAGFWFDGLVGAVNGCLVATAVVAAATFILVRRTFTLPIPLADWSRIALAAGIMLSAVRLLPNLPDHEPIQLVSEVAAGAAIYGVALLLLFPLRARKMVQRVFEVGWPQSVIAKR